MEGTWRGDGGEKADLLVEVRVVWVQETMACERSFSSIWGE